MLRSIFDGLDLRRYFRLQAIQNMTVAQLVIELSLKLLKLLPNLNILLIGLLERSLIVFLLLVDKEDLVFLACEDLRQLSDPVLGLS